MGGEKLSNAKKNDSGRDDSSGQSANKANGNHHEHLPSSNGDGVRKFGFTTYIGEIVLAGLCGTGVWIFGEHLVSHGYVKSGVVVNFLAFAIYFAAAPITAIRFWPNPWWVWGTFGAFIAIMAIIFIVTSNAPSESKVHTHFKFSLVNPETLESTFDFTNNIFDEARIRFPNPLFGVLVFPTTKSNMDLCFVIKNDGPNDVEDIEIMATFSSQILCESDSRWSRIKDLSSYITASAHEMAVTNKLCSFECSIAHLLVGDSDILPTLHFRDVPLTTLSIDKPLIPIFIMAKAKTLHHRGWFF